MSEETNGGPHYVKFPAYLVLALRDAPQSQAILLYVIWRNGVKTSHPDGKWHIRISDIARTLGKQEKTVRKHLKPLVQMGLLNLTGTFGDQHYLLSKECYEKYLAMVPMKPVAEPPPKTPPPSQKMGAHPLPNFGTSPLPRNGTLKQIEESRKTVQSSTVPPDGTEQKLEPNHQQKTTSSSMKEAVRFSSHGSPNAPDGAPEDGTGQDQTKRSPAKPVGSSLADLPGGEAVPPAGLDCTPVDSRSRGQGSANRPKAVPSRPVFVLSKQSVSLPLPKNVGINVSAKRQAAIVEALNKGGYQFQREGPVTFEVRGYKISAYDPEAQVILLTGPFHYAASDYVQRLCSEFAAHGWKVMIWTEDDQCLHGIVEANEPSTEAAN